MNKMRIVFLQILLLAAVNNLCAQNAGRSTLKGFVTDELGAMPSVSLHIKGTQTGTASATDGTFIISNAPPGKAILAVSFIGYEKQERELDLQPGLNIIEEIRLTSSVSSLQEVIISGEMAPSQMKAYNMKKLSPGIVDLIVSDAIGGSINFITRTTPVRRTLAISGAGGFNNLAQKERQSIRLTVESNRRKRVQRAVADVTCPLRG